MFRDIPEKITNAIVAGLICGLKILATSRRQLAAKSTALAYANCMTSHFATKPFHHNPNPTIAFWKLSCSKLSKIVF